MSPAHVIAVGIGGVSLDGYDRAPLSFAADAPQDAILELAGALRSDAVAILPQARAEPALRRLQVLQSALDGRHRIACYATALPPLAASVLARLATAAGEELPAGLLADALPALEHELLIAAVLPSVLRLPSPQPPFGARLRSLLPGARFLVSPEPEAIVAPVHGNHTPPVLLDHAADEVAVVTAGRLRGFTDAERLLSTVFGGAPVEEVDAPTGLAGRWRTSQAIEAVAYPTDAARMARRLLATPSTTCPWCGAPHAALPCALCGHDRDRAIGRQEMMA